MSGTGPGLPAAWALILRIEHLGGVCEAFHRLTSSLNCAGFAVGRCGQCL